MIVKKIESKHINQISKIWENNLKENLYSILGTKLIKVYLQICLKENNFGFVLENKKDVCGFVIYGKDNNINKVIIKKYFINIFYKFFLNLICFNFKNFYHFIDVFLYLIASNKKDEKLKNTCELLIISIEKKYQRKGWGKKLVYKAEKNIYKLEKINKTFVKTTQKENILFYKNLNFKILKKIFNRTYLLKKINYE